jgi:hypothetical protein
MLTENATKSATNRQFLKSEYFGYTSKKKTKTICN